MSEAFTFFMATQYLYTYTIIYITSLHKLMDLGYFQVFAIINNTAKIKPAQLFFYTCAKITVANNLKLGIAESKGKSIFNVES